MGVFEEDLRTAWAKLDDAKKQALSQSYQAARLKYLLKAGMRIPSGRKKKRRRIRWALPKAVHSACHRAIRRSGSVDSGADRQRVFRSHQHR